MQYVVIDGKKHTISWRDVTYTAKVLAPLIGVQAVCHSKRQDISDTLRMVRAIFDRDVLETYHFSALIGVMTLNAYVVPEQVTREAVKCTRGINLEDPGTYRPETVVRMAAKAASYISSRTAELHYVIEESCESFDYGASSDSWEGYRRARENASCCGHLSMGHAAHLLSVWTGVKSTGGEQQCAHGCVESTTEHYPEAAVSGLIEWMRGSPRGCPCDGTEYAGNWILSGDKIPRLRKAGVQPVVCTVPGLDGPIGNTPCWHHYPMGAAISAIGPRKFKDRDGYSSDVAQWLKLGAGGRQCCCTGPGLNFLGLPSACNQCLGTSLGRDARPVGEWRLTTCSLAKVLGVAQYTFKGAVLRIAEVAAREAASDMTRARAVLHDLANGTSEQMSFLQALSRAAQDPDRKRVRLLLATQDPVTRASVAREADVLEAWNSAVVRRVHHCCPWDKVVKHPEVSSYAAYMTLTEEAFTAWGSMASIPPTRLCDYTGWEECVSKLPEGLRMVLGRASLHRVMGLDESTQESFAPAPAKLLMAPASRPASLPGVKAAGPVSLVKGPDAWPSGADAVGSSALVGLQIPKQPVYTFANGDDCALDMPCFEPVDGSTDISAEPRFRRGVARVDPAAGAWTTEGQRLYSRAIEDLVEEPGEMSAYQRARIKNWMNLTEAEEVAVAHDRLRVAAGTKAARCGTRTLDIQKGIARGLVPACVISERVSGTRFARMSDSEDSLDGRPVRTYARNQGPVDTGRGTPSDSESEWGRYSDSDGAIGRNDVSLEADDIVWPLNADDMV